MSNTITGKRQSSWDRFHTDGKIKVIRSTGVLGTAYSGTGYTVPSGQVLLIDKVQISAHWDSADASTTNYVPVASQWFVWLKLRQRELHLREQHW